MITFFDNIAKRRKKPLKHHSGAMLLTVLRYAQASNVALLLIVELVVKIAAGIFCLFTPKDMKTPIPTTNGKSFQELGRNIKRHNFRNRKMYAGLGYYVAKSEKHP
jgi:hypothetical protein